MNIVFYSTCSTAFDGNTFHYANTPLCKDKLETVTELYPEHNFFVVAQQPGMFLLDLNNTELLQKAENVTYTLPETNATVQQIADTILSLNPDAAISITGFFRPFDWQGLKDGLIKKELEKHNVKVICNSAETQAICFYKNLTQSFLEQNGFKVPRSISIDHQLYWAERNHNEVLENLYKETILSQLKDFNYPVIIKDSTGLSSFGMEVVTTFNQAKAFLNSKKNNGNKLVQELVKGKQFGMEVFGTDENYLISDPFQFSVNQYGITSPKQSVKAGPVTKDEFKIGEIKAAVGRLCTLLNINGSAQIDLVFDGTEWYIIEINPRLSGMTNTVCQSWDTNYFKLLLSAALGKKENLNQVPVLSVKLPLIEAETKNRLSEYNFIRQINQTQNDAAKQQRETGYCEIIIQALNSIELKNNLNTLKNNFPELIDEGFYEQSLTLLQDME